MTEKKLRVLVAEDGEGPAAEALQNVFPGQESQVDVSTVCVESEPHGAGDPG